MGIELEGEGEGPAWDEEGGNREVMGMNWAVWVRVSSSVPLCALLVQVPIEGSC